MRSGYENYRNLYNPLLERYLIMENKGKNKKSTATKTSTKKDDKKKKQNIPKPPKTLYIWD